MNLSNTLLSMLSEQFRIESSNYLRYTQRRAWCDFHGLTGLETFFTQEAADETGHAQLVIEYIMDRSGLIKIEPYEYNGPGEFAKTIDLFTTALEVEQMTTQSLTNIYQQATREADVMTINFMQKMIDKQIEEEKTYQTILDRYTMYPESPSRDHDFDKWVKKEFVR